MEQKTINTLETKCSVNSLSTLKTAHSTLTGSKKKKNNNNNNEKKEKKEKKTNNTEKKEQKTNNNEKKEKKTNNNEKKEKKTNNDEKKQKKKTNNKEKKQQKKTKTKNKEQQTSKSVSQQLPKQQQASIRTNRIKSKQSSLSPGKSAQSAQSIAPLPLSSKLESKSLQIAAKFDDKKSIRSTKTIASTGTAKPITLQARMEMLERLRAKLRDIDKRKAKDSPGAEPDNRSSRTTKKGRSAKWVAAPIASETISGQIGGIGGGGGSDPIRGGYHNRLSMSRIDSHLQQYTLRFVDLIVCCTVVDNYMFGLLIFAASIAAITIGWIKMDECNVATSLPYALMINGVLNIIYVYVRNLAHHRILDYFVMSLFRLFALFSLIVVGIFVSQIDTQLLIRSLPPDRYYTSYDGVIYCASGLYYFTFYYCVISASFVGGLAIYGLACIVYIRVERNRQKFANQTFVTSSSSSGGGGGDDYHNPPTADLLFHRHDTGSADAPPKISLAPRPSHSPPHPLRLLTPKQFAARLKKK